MLSACRASRTTCEGLTKRDTTERGIFEKWTAEIAPGGNALVVRLVAHPVEMPAPELLRLAKSAGLFRVFETGKFLPLRLFLMCEETKIEQMHAALAVRSSALLCSSCERSSEPCFLKPNLKTNL